MQPTITRGCLIAALSLFAPAGGTATAVPAAGTEQSLHASQARLAALRARIAALTGRLGDAVAARDALRAGLRQAETDVTAARQRVDALHAAQAAALRRSAALQAEQTRRRGELGAARTVLAGEMRAAYITGHREALQFLLNQRDPASAGRMLTYYGYFTRERAAQIGVIETGMRRLADLAAEIRSQAAALAALADAAREELGGLVRARAARAAALAALAAEVHSGTRELADLKREETAVEALLQDLARVLEDFPVDTQEPFGKQRGKLPWPVPGRVTAGYQDPRRDATQGGLRWNGLLIETARGSKVRAPYYGRVLYADWLAGLGLLIILGHNGDFLTLYGHAEVLYKTVGDWVAPGDIIAGLDDGEGARPTLYFEIRQGRKTVDPTPWMKASP